MVPTLAPIALPSVYCLSITVSLSFALADFPVYGMHSLVHQTLVFGITLVIVPDFDPKLFLEYIKAYPPL